MIRRPPRSTLSSSSAASDVYKRQQGRCPRQRVPFHCARRHHVEFHGTRGREIERLATSLLAEVPKRGFCRGVVVSTHRGHAVTIRLPVDQARIHIQGQGHGVQDVVGSTCWDLPFNDVRLDTPRGLLGNLQGQSIVVGNQGQSRSGSRRGHTNKVRSTVQEDLEGPCQ